MHATGSWSNTAWDEQEFDAKDGLKKLVTVKMATKYEGTLEGTSSVNYLMVYGDDGKGVYCGLERFEGSVDGKAGSFVIKQDGTFREDGVTANCEIVPGSASGDLIGIQGSWVAELSGHGPYPYDIEISFK